MHETLRVCKICTTMFVQLYKIVFVTSLTGKECYVIEGKRRYVK